MYKLETFANIQATSHAIVKIELYSSDFLIFDSIVSYLTPSKRCYLEIQFLMHGSMSGKVYLYVVVIKI